MLGWRFWWLGVWLSGGCLLVAVLRVLWFGFVGWLRMLFSYLGLVAGLSLVFLGFNCVVLVYFVAV